MVTAIPDIIFRVTMVICGLGVLYPGLLILPVARKLIRGEISRKNYMGRGIKIKEADDSDESFASDEAWYRINRGGGKLLIIPSLAFIAMGLTMIACALLYPGGIIAILVAGMACILVSLLPLFGYVIWVKRTEPKRKAA